MCEFCVQHGEGKKWYLQAKHYSQEMVSDERRSMIETFGSDYEKLMADGVGKISRAVAEDPAKAESLFPVHTQLLKKFHWGQVVPIEEIEQILDMTLSVVRVPCACRSTLKGFREARYCFGLTGTGSDPSTTPRKRHPDFSSGVETLDRDEAKQAMRKLDKLGLVHSVWTFVSPHIGGVCNCSINDCVALRTRERVGMQTMFKAEYVATIDWETCNGCRNCMRMCNFGAIGYSAYANKCTVDQLQCYGCGVCRAICHKKSITLQDRNANPMLVNEW
jgi:ferredoxin